jgi:sulfatase modifying factor 1
VDQPDGIATKARKWAPAAVSLLIVLSLVGLTLWSQSGAGLRPSEALRGGTGLDKSPVTVDQFAAFVQETGHVTEAERLGGGQVILFPLGRWRIDPEATWKRPWGASRSGEMAPGDHPVTQVSWNDASAYCSWTGGRLPTVEEWTLAARSGHPEDAPYAVGSDIERDGVFLAKIWSGAFPFHNDGRNGQIGTVPVGQTGLTPTGLTDMAGNVWNWMQDDRNDPGLGPEGAQKALKGGSFLCDPYVCRGYDIAARQSATPDTSAVHIGFRCAGSASPSRARQQDNQRATG